MAKTVLLIVPVTDSSASVHDAAAFCEKIGAHLSVLVAAFAPPVPIGEYGLAVSDSWSRERQSDLEKLQKAVDGVTQLLAAYGASSDVSTAYAEAGVMDEEIGRRAMYTDLTLVNATDNNDKILPTAAIEGTLFNARNAVLLTSSGVEGAWPPKRVMIAWDSRVEAARAVHESLDYLQGAEDVRVVMVDPQAHGESGAEPGADIAAFLARRGLKVTVDRLPSAGHLISDVLTQRAADMQADLIVMGAYGHSRLRERIFGGVTKSMLEKPPLPLFLAR
jgi:nucleotide-binding universal stress UspA family protein